MLRLPCAIALVILSGCLSAGGVQRTPASANEKVLTVAELERIGTTPGEYVVEGYLVGVELCPPCPEGAACERCRDENISISDRPKLVTGYSVPGRGYAILEPMDMSYALGRRYRLRIEIPELAPLGDSPPRIGRVMEAQLLP